MATGTNAISAINDLYTSVNNGGDWNNLVTAISKLYGEYCGENTTAGANQWNGNLCAPKNAWLSINDYAKNGTIKISNSYDNKRLIKFSDLIYELNAGTINVTPTTWAAPVGGGSQSIGVSFTNSDSYGVSESLSWLSTSKGTSATTLTATANDTTAERSGNVTFWCVGRNGVTATANVTVSQKGKSQLTVNPTSLSFTPDSASKTFTVGLSNISTYTASLESTASWCTVTQSGTTVTVKCEKNTGVARSVRVKVTATGTTDSKSHTSYVTINQDNGVSSISVNPTSRTFTPPLQGNTATVSQTNLSSWSVASDQTWLTVAKNGNNIAYTATLNKSAQRVATIYVHGVGKYDNKNVTASLTITQNNGASSISIKDTTASFTKDGGNKTHTVTPTNLSSWGATSNASWCTVSKSGNNVTITTAKTNSASDRTATVTVYGKGQYDETNRTATVSVSQAGGAASISVSPTSQSFTPAQGGNTATVTTSNINWTVSDNADWLTVAKAGSGIAYTASKNSGVTRTGYISIYGTGTYASEAKGVTLTVTQSSGVSNITISSSKNYAPDAQSNKTATVSRTNMDSYTAKASNDWITVTQSGDTVTYSLSKNSGDARTGTIYAYGTGKYDSASRTASIQVSQSSGKSSITVTATSKDFGVDGGSNSHTVNPVNLNSWTAASSQSWCTYNISNNTLTITAAKTDSGATRTAYVYVYGTGKYDNASRTATVTITQAAGNGTFSLNPTSLSFSKDGETKTSTITKTRMGTMYATSSVSWATATISDTTISVKVAKTNSASDRSGTITVHGKGSYDGAGDTATISISQANGAASISVSPTSRSFTPEQGGNTATVSRTNVSTWYATSSQSWLTVAKNGNNIAYTASKNSGNARTAYIYVHGNGDYVGSVTATLTVTQSSGVSSIDITPTTSSFTKDGGNSSHTVTPTNLSSWGATSNASWCTATKSGNTVTITTAKTNSASTRTATVTVYGTGAYDNGYRTDTVAVSQAGGAPSISVSPTTWVMTSNAAANKEFTVTLTNASGFKVTDLASWLTISSTASNKFTLSASKNNSGDRSDVIYVSTTGSYTNGAVTASITITQEGSSSLSVSPTTVTLGPAKDQTTDVTVTATNMSTWNTAASVNWLTVTKGSGKVTIKSNVANSGDSRKGYVYVSGVGDSDNVAATATITVTQNSGVSSIDITPATSSFTKDGGNSSHTVTPTNLSSWGVTSNTTWCTATKSGNTVTITTAKTNSASTRTATVTVYGTGAYDNGYRTDTVSVSQANGAASISVSPTSRTLTPALGGNTATVSRTNVSTWYATSSQSWLTVAKNGNNIAYTATKNSGNTRSAYIYVHGNGDYVGSVTATLTVTQSSGISSIDITPTTSSFTKDGGNSSHTVTPTNLSSFGVTSNTTWCTATKSGNTVTITTAKTNSASDRTATVTVYGTGAYDNGYRTDTVSVSQAGGAASISVSPTSRTLTPALGGNTATVTRTNVSTWYATSSQSWLTVAKNGNNIAYTATKNSGNARSAYIYVHGNGDYVGSVTATLTVTQNSGVSSISISPTTQIVGATANSFAVIVSPTNISYSYSSNSDWCTVSKSSDTLTISTTKNTGSARTAYVSVYGTGTYDNQSRSATLTVSQSRGSSSISVLPTTSSFTKDGGNSSHTVTPTNLSSWGVTSNTTWCTATKSGNTVTITTAKTNSASDRTATVTVYGTGSVDNQYRTSTVSVSQAGGAASISVSPTSRTLTPALGGNTATVSRTNVSTWYATSSQTWLTVAKNGNNIAYTATKNSGNARSAYIYVHGKGDYASESVTATLTVTQNSGVSSISISPTSKTVGATANSFSAAITPTNISWSYSSNSDWCTITKSGNNLTISTTKNTGSARTAYVSVYGNGTYDNQSRSATLTVTQSRGSSAISVSPTSVTSTVVDAKSWATKVTMTNMATYSYSSDQSWCTVSNNGVTMTISATKNTSTDRTATVTVFGTGSVDDTKRTATVTVKQKGKSSIGVTPTSLSFTYAASSQTVTVGRTNLSSYTATSDSDWCTVSKSGDTITVTVTKNTGVARSAKITVSGTGDSDSTTRSAQIVVNQEAYTIIDLSISISRNPLILGSTATMMAMITAVATYSDGTTGSITPSSLTYSIAGPIGVTSITAGIMVVVGATAGTGTFSAKYTYNGVEVTSNIVTVMVITSSNTGSTSASYTYNLSIGYKNIYTSVGAPSIAGGAYISLPLCATYSIYKNGSLQSATDVTNSCTWTTANSTYFSATAGVVHPKGISAANKSTKVYATYQGLTASVSATGNPHKRLGISISATGSAKSQSITLIWANGSYSGISLTPRQSNGKTGPSCILYYPTWTTVVNYGTPNNTPSFDVSYVVSTMSCNYFDLFCGRTGSSLTISSYGETYTFAATGNKFILTPHAMEAWWQSGTAYLTISQ